MSLPSALRHNYMSDAIMGGDYGMYWHIDGGLDDRRGLDALAIT